jgi:hypothetical protein
MEQKRHWQLRAAAFEALLLAHARPVELSKFVLAASGLLPPFATWQQLDSWLSRGGK